MSAHWIDRHRVDKSIALAVPYQMILPTLTDIRYLAISTIQLHDYNYLPFLDLSTWLVFLVQCTLPFLLTALPYRA